MSWLIGVILLMAASLGVVGNSPASIGGTEVPELSCEEDEVIAFVWIDTIRCVHIEIIRAG